MPFDPPPRDLRDQDETVIDIAEIALSVVVPVPLVYVRYRWAVVTCVAQAICVRVILKRVIGRGTIDAGIPVHVAVDVLLVLVGHKNAVVTGIPELVMIRIQLGGVVGGSTIVTGVVNAISICVDAKRVVIDLSIAIVIQRIARNSRIRGEPSNPRHFALPLQTATTTLA